MFIYLSISIYLSIYLFICLSIYLSIKFDMKFYSDLPVFRIIIIYWFLQSICIKNSVTKFNKWTRTKLGSVLLFVSFFVDISSCNVMIFFPLRILLYHAFQM